MSLAPLDKFRVICPVATDRADLAAYEVDGRGAGDGRAAGVARPRNAAEVSAIMREAAATGTRLVVQGGRTGLVGAGLPGQHGDHLIVSVDRLDRILDIDVANRTATVEAGVTLSALNAALAPLGLCLPIDLGADPTIGGMVASNTGGARLIRYGDLRHNLLAIEMVAADSTGTILSLGRALWKDNSGLDLKQMIIGGAGSMGIVTAATLALQPLPAIRTTALLSLADPAAALDILLRVEAAFGALLTAYEGMSRAALAAAIAHAPNLRNPFPRAIPPYAVLIELSAGHAIDHDHLEARLADLVAPLMEGTQAPVADAVIDRRDALWAIRHAIPEGLRAMGKVVACDVALRRGDVARFRAQLIARLAEQAPALLLCDFGHVGDGGMHFNMVWPAAAGPYDAEQAERARALVFASAVEEFGGSFSAEHGVGPRNATAYARFVPTIERRLAGALQHVMAPVPIGRVDFATGQART